MRKHQAWVAAAVAAGLSGVSPLAFAVDNVWTGATNTDWNTPTNWSLGRVPVKANGQPAPNDFDDAVVNVNANFPVITADLAAVPRDIIVGQGAGVNGRVDHTAGTATTGDGNWLYIGRDAGSGVYNLANTATTGGTLTGFGLGSGSIDVGGGTAHTGTAGRVYVGGTEFGNTGLNGTFNVNTSGTLTIRNDLNVGTDGGNGLMNVDAGTITTGGWNFIGKRVNKDAAVGVLNMGGGTLTNSGRTYVAQTTTTGTLNLTGGQYTQNDVLIIGEGANSHGAVNVTSAASTLTVNSEIWVGQATGGNGAMSVSAGKVTLNNWLAVGREGSTGVLTVSGNGIVEKVGGGQITIGTGAGGNGTVNVSGNGQLSTNNDMIVAENNATAIGTVNQTGGKVSVGGNLEVQRTGTGTYNMSGGTLSVNGNIDGVDGTFSFTGGRLTRGNAGVINYSGNLLVSNKLAGFALGTDKTFNVTGTLNVGAGITFDVTGQALPAAGGGVQTGTIHLGNDGLIVGTFDPLLTTVSGLSNPSGAAFISETQGEGGLYNANTQSVFWVQENAGSVDLKYSIAPVPEPTALGFIAVGGLALATRRRGRK